MSLVDPCLEKELREKASQLGWKTTEFNFAVLDSDDWGELKKEIGEEREQNELIHYRFSDSSLDRKASEDHRIDSVIITDQAPEEATVKNLSDNSTAITLDFSSLLETSRKRKNSILSEWRRTIFLADKHGIELYVTTGAESEFDLRPPEMLKSLINSLNTDLDNPEDKITNNREKMERN